MRTLLLSLGIGALAMYLLDPENGRKRRGRMREQLDQMKQALRERASSLAPGSASEPDLPGASDPSKSSRRPQTELNAPF